MQRSKSPLRRDPALRSPSRKVLMNHDNSSYQPLQTQKTQFVDPNLLLEPINQLISSFSSLQNVLRDWEPEFEVRMKAFDSIQTENIKAKENRAKDQDNLKVVEVLLESFSLPDDIEKTCELNLDSLVNIKQVSDATKIIKSKLDLCYGDLAVYDSYLVFRERQAFFRKLLNRISRNLNSFSEKTILYTIQTQKELKREEFTWSELSVTFAPLTDLYALIYSFMPRKVEQIVDFFFNQTDPINIVNFKNYLKSTTKSTTANAVSSYYSRYLTAYPELNVSAEDASINKAMTTVLNAVAKMIVSHSDLLLKTFQITESNGVEKLSDHLREIIAETMRFLGSICTSLPSLCISLTVINKVFAAYTTKPLMLISFEETCRAFVYDAIEKIVDAHKSSLNTGKVKDIKKSSINPLVFTTVKMFNLFGFTIPDVTTRDVNFIEALIKSIDLALSTFLAEATKDNAKYKPIFLTEQYYFLCTINPLFDDLEIYKTLKTKYSRSYTINSGIYIKWLFDDQFKKLVEFVTGVDTLISSGTKKCDVGFKNQYHESVINSILKDLSSKLKSHILNIKGRVNRHFSASVILHDAIWHEVIENFTERWIKITERLLECYPELKITPSTDDWRRMLENAQYTQ